MYYCFESHIIFYTISCGFLIDITHQHVKDWFSEIKFFLGYVESKSRYFFQKQKKKIIFNEKYGWFYFAKNKQQMNTIYWTYIDVRNA